MDADGRLLCNRTSNWGKTVSGFSLKLWRAPESVGDIAFEHGLEEASSG